MGAWRAHEGSLGKDAWDMQAGLVGSKEEPAPDVVSGRFEDDSGIG